MNETADENKESGERGPRPRPVVLCVLDGWGYRAESEDNAIALADTPVWDGLVRDYPAAFLDTSGEAVGLPAGQMGNSEVGHMNLGGGRVVKQELPRIDEAIEAGTLKTNKILNDLIEATRRGGGAVHLMGLISPGGVHSHQDHIAELVRLIDAAGVPVRLHALLDGRDTPPQSAATYVERLQSDIASCRDARIVTVSGRYYAMDRDKRWDRIHSAYDAIVDADGLMADDAGQAIARAYEREETDEFVQPTVIGGYAGIKDGDALLMANFRADRARQILTALLDPGFGEFARRRRPDFSAAAGMVEYSDELNRFLPALFPKQAVVNTLGEVVASAGLRQLRIAETEKYAHVTFFLNGGEERTYEGEDRILVPSPKVATYDLKPEMSAPEVTDKLVEAIETDRYDLIVVNYANPDMVGHTGKMDAALKAVETIDTCLGRLSEAVRDAGGAMLITADHGNIELMRDGGTDQPHTAHTTFIVPLVLVAADAGGLRDVDLGDGRLADVAPTVLDIMGLAQPEEMTGRSLVDGKRRAGRGGPGPTQERKSHVPAE